MPLIELSIVNPSFRHLNHRRRTRPPSLLSQSPLRLWARAMLPPPLPLKTGQVSTLQPNTSSTPAKSSSAAGTPPSATKGAVKSEPNTKQNATKAAAMPVTGQDAGITATDTADAQKNGDEAKTAPADSSKAAAKPKPDKKSVRKRRENAASHPPKQPLERRRERKRRRKRNTTSILTTSTKPPAA